MLQYETLDVLIEKNGAGYVARIVNSPVGQARTSFAPPFTPDELKTFFARVAGREPTSGSTLSPQQWIEQMGARLFDAVFHDETLITYRRSRDEAERQAKGLRVRLRLNDAPELADLPWEYLYDATRRNYLALSKETPIVRYLELSERVKPLAAPAPINLLAVLASPQDRDALDVEGEWTRLQNALAELVAQNKIRLTRLAPPTLDALRAQLRQAEYHILHFIGHGDYDPIQQQGSLAFQDERGNARRVNQDMAATLLQDARTLRVIVLNACQGAQTSTQNPFAGTAPRLVQAGFPAVLAMQFKISDQAALDFSAEFYKTLADGYPVDAATNEARRAVYSNGNQVEWGTPVLFMRAEDGILFTVPETAKDGAISEKRYLDAALPAKVEVGKPVELYAMVRLQNSQGLAGLIADGEIERLTPQDIKAKGIDVAFESDDKGRVKDLILLLEVESSDFVINTKRIKISLQRSKDSELVRFLMTPLRRGRLSVILRVYTIDETQIMNGALQVTGVSFLDKGIRPVSALVTLALGTFGVKRSGDEGGGVSKQQNDRPQGGGSGGINISGGNIHVGGDVVNGDKIVQGDEIHAGGAVNVVNIGAGAQVGQVAAGNNITQTQGASAQDLAALFNAIYKQIDARLNDPNVERGEIRDTVKNIETEAGKGENANPNKIERWMKSLKELAPDILEVTAAALLNPLAGVSAAIKKIAAKARGDKS